mmetsp:Transcript_32925/g.48697  ORF Transcript_32925/g.48697 Transcript_32925/m.48697 type:complete len:617 (-) Transcript_32925:1236-3086(-)|eukprot:CAMPEP_0194217216 /NCGR_PEP_ID=MMETSP0156-20130528/20661_1 /TAXON_ID=33649 /ORGANISM="Thalassionema nitzschioides, Strain L26-B" /LENGTH=616 /DNA_ID=CAMNT_0038946197 /DNA_START=84 /DNA_END=1934 /DNA_ORIENTATION=+
MKVSSLAVSALVVIAKVHAFVQHGNGQYIRKQTGLFTGEEDILRQEIANKNSVVKNEKKYALRDVEGIQGAFVTESQQDESQIVDKESLKARMTRMTKLRAYPLFLAEKAAEIVEHAVDDVFKTFKTSDQYQDELEDRREKVVVLGTGWGAASFLKDIDTSKYEVTVISPRNFFLFTPMLAGASVGTVEYRSITEPIREINRRVNFLEATATSIDPGTLSVTCESVVCDGNSCEIEDFVVNYDRLIVMIGAQTNTFGIPGVREHCCFLKQVDDARRVRSSIVNCFERANIPGMSEEARINNLTFAVIGAGPTGIEFASELRDFIEQDGPKYYPKLLKYVRIKVIEASKTILAPFEESLQKEAIKQLRRTISIKDPDASNLLPESFQLTELLLESSVKEVKAKSIELNNGASIPYGLAVWAAGNGPLPLTLQLIDTLGEQQAILQNDARGRIAIDPWLRVVGGNGKILALGDCSCNTACQLPATAQVASQQAEYLASLFNTNYNMMPKMEGNIFPPPTQDPEQPKSLSESIADFACQGYDYARPFQFLNLGILAYTGGGSALAQLSVDSANIKGKGPLGNAVWRSVYLTKQVSWRNRFLVLNDWAKRQLFGRDITQV